MRISFNTHPGGENLNTGFGYAGFNVVTSLQRLGHVVPFNDPDAPVQIFFTHPEHFVRRPGQYSILYFPWESTELKPGWLEIMNTADEVWTPSDLIAKWFVKCGVTVPVKVFKHGVTKSWEPKLRTPTEKIRFLHHGSEATRKCGQETLEAFLDVFGRDNDDVQLTFKSNGPAGMRIYTNGHLYTPDKISNNIKLIPRELSLDSLIGLYETSHCMLYPSQGEGFGLAPLQAMATGMPVILNSIWAPYRKLTIKELRISSRPVQSTHEVEHPGKVLEPNYEELCNVMKYYYKNYKKCSKLAYTNATLVHEQYDWTKLTKDAFKHIVDMFD